MEWTVWLQALFGLGVVAGLMWALQWIITRTPAGARLRAASAGTTLKIEEVLHIDPKRRVILLSRSNMRYVVLVSPTGETVIETYIETYAQPDAPSTH